MIMTMGHSHQDHEAPLAAEPYQFKMQAFVGGMLGVHYLPHPILSPGIESGVLFGVQQGKKHFMLGPVLQWNRGHRQMYGIETDSRHLFAGMELQLGRSLGKRWSLALSPVLGLRQLRATDLVLNQGIIVDVKDIAFELQGKIRVSIQAKRGLGFFCQFHLGQAFYLTFQEVFPLGGFHLGTSLGFFWVVKNKAPLNKNQGGALISGQGSSQIELGCC
jgi:hypothetical protein